MLDPICAHVFEEKASRRRLIKNRPQLLAALDQLRPDDMLVGTTTKCPRPRWVVLVAGTSAQGSFFSAE